MLSLLARLPTILKTATASVTMFQAEERGDGIRSGELAQTQDPLSFLFDVSQKSNHARPAKEGVLTQQPASAMSAPHGAVVQRTATGSKKKPASCPSMHMWRFCRENATIGATVSSR